MLKSIKRLPLVCLAGLFLSAAAQPAQDSGSSREYSSIVEEQALLLRQLGRLRGTMNVLLTSLEAEGREGTATILRNALQRLDERTELNEDGHPLTMEERMDRIHESLSKRQLIQSLTRQKALVSELEVLLSILLDRKNLDSLEEKIDELRQMQESIKQLASREEELRQDTEKLRESSSNDTQRQLEERLENLAQLQKELLRENETQGRESGSLELEELEKALDRLLSDQRQDAQVLAAWNPREETPLSAARQPMTRALAAEQQAANLEQTQDTLAAVQEALEKSQGPNPEEGLDAARLKALQERIEAALKEARRRSELATDEASLSKSMEALGAAKEALAQASSGPQESAAAQASIEAARQALARAADLARAEAQAARGEALQALKPLAQSKDSLAGREAQAIEELLERAQAEAEGGDKRQAASSTAEAQAQLDRARSDLANLAEALAGAQAEQAKQTERLERGLGTMPQAKTPAGEQAGEALKEAAQAMKDASEAARQGDAEAAASQANQAEAALEKALSSVGQSRAQAGSQQAKAQEATAKAQAKAAEQAGQIQEMGASASMNEAGQEALEQAMQAAERAMQQAQEELQEGRSASAAQSQRDALSNLGEAQKAARDSVSPKSQADQAEAARLAQEQERIKQEILDLAKRIAERENASPTPNMERAQEAAQSAQGSLEEGDLSGAKEQEEKVIQELEQTAQQLEEEEEQYQTLRDEEKLFAIAEELQTMLATHVAQMQALTEVDSARQPGAQPSRAQRLHLRRIAREEETLATRSREMASALAEEGSTVSGQLLSDTADDLDRVAEALGDRGNHETGDRTQALQRDAEETMIWILEALQEEQERRKDPEEKKQQQQQQQQGEDQQKESLIPDTAELKLLRRMEIRLQKSVELILELNPELGDPEAVDPFVLRDIERLALQHAKITEQFILMRKRLGLTPGE